MKKLKPLKRSVRHEARPSQLHTCFCGRRLHSNDAWNEHKQRCANWTQPKENQS